jgi:twinkle protein
MTTLEDKVEKLIISEKEIRSYFDSRDNEEHTKIKSPKDYIEEIKEYFVGDYHKGALLPWKCAKDCFRVRPSEMSIWSGWSGHGKSLVLNQVMLEMLKEQKVMIASFEMKPRSTLARAIRQTANSSNPEPDFIEKFCERADGKLWLYDQQGMVTPSMVMSVIYYSAEKLGCTQIVVDSMMKCGVAEDDFQGQKRFVDELSTAARDLNIHIHLVAHSRKRSDESMAPPSKHDVSGSANITNLADNVFVQFRVDKAKHEASGRHTALEMAQMPDAMLYCVKQRHFEWEGSFQLWFNVDSLRYREHMI